MKVAVSIPDPIGRRADRVARRLRIPRSRLYARAIEEFLRTQEDSSITERLNAVYGKPGATLDPAVQAQALETLRRVEWDD
jgi:hypothetical protein